MSHLIFGPLSGCLEALERCERVALTIPRDVYSNPNHSIGAHLRHILEHVTSLLDGIESKTVAYDERERDFRLERSPQYYLEAVEDARRRLIQLGDIAINEAITVRLIPDASSSAIDTPSSISRELLFVASHAIHHLALIRLAAEKVHVSVPEELTIAYSTAAYREQLAK